MQNDQSKNGQPVSVGFTGGSADRRLTAWDAENLDRLRRGNLWRRRCNGVTVQSLNRLVKKGLAVRFTGAFGEDEWAISPNKPAEERPAGRNS